MRQTFRIIPFFFAGLLCWSGCEQQAQAEGPNEAGQIAKVKAAPKSQIKPAANPLLWKIEGGKQVGFVFGTIHLPDERVTQLPPAVEKAFAAAGEVQTEIPMDTATQMSMTPKLFLPDGKTLKDVLPEDLFKRLEAIFSSKGLPMAGLDRLKVWAVAAQLALLDKLIELATKKPLDAQLYERAGREGKKQGALETVDEQIGVFESLSMEEQVRMLRQTMDMMDEKKKEGGDPLEDLLQAYLSGDEKKILDAIYEEYDPDNELDRKIMQRVFLDRNHHMAERIAKHLRVAGKPVTFFAVGAGHLVGDEGIIALLKKDGFKLTRMK